VAAAAASFSNIAAAAARDWSTIKKAPLPMYSAYQIFILHTLPIPQVANLRQREVFAALKQSEFKVGRRAHTCLSSANPFFSVAKLIATFSHLRSS
jgi:hypothetical protein